MPRPDASNPLRYMPQLDALRAIAVIGVFISHFELGSLPGFLWLPWGDLGVRLFFVLSGYLITGILLRARDMRDAAGQSHMQLAARFYARRFLRIFPVYYLTLGVLVWVVYQLRQAFWWHLFYVSNFYFAYRGDKSVAGSHFWTLAVEEQFYLVWPWLILLLNRRAIGVVIAAALAVGPLYRALCGILGLPEFYATLLPMGCLDQFACGALLAWIESEPSFSWKRPAFLRTCLVCGLPVLVLVLVNRQWELIRLTTLDPALSLAAMGLVFTWLIGRSAAGFGGIVGKALEFKPLVYLGRISYGVYIYHGFLGWLFGSVLPRFHVFIPQNPWVKFPLYSAISIGLGIISWHFFEKPINRLKRYFEYVEPARDASSSVV